MLRFAETMKRQQANSADRRPPRTPLLAAGSNEWEPVNASRQVNCYIIGLTPKKRQVVGPRSREPMFSIAPFATLAVG